MDTTSNITAAIEDFRRARRQAAIQEVFARITGESTDLLSFDEVRGKLKAGSSSMRGLQEIPLDAIVGSVGRYKDFTRSFLPRQDHDERRWAGVMAATTDIAGLPPIEVYQIGEAYFVLDGNHRVSVARQLGNQSIQAYVTEYKTKVPLSPNDKPDDLALKAEYTDFLEQTKLDELRPEADLRLTEGGRYWELKTQIDAFHFMMDQERDEATPYPEAVQGWYDEVYSPIIQVIRERGILHDFPNRTETDLYLWIFRHRSELEKQLGWEIDPDTAAADLAAVHHKETTAGVNDKLIEALTPDSLEAGPAPGQWRHERLGPRAKDRLFANILVPLTGTEASWSALTQALTIARREQSHLYGLHVVATAEAQESDAIEALRHDFKQRCEAAGIRGELSIQVGPTARTIAERARWADLVVIHLAHPPGEQVASKLSSGFRTVLYRCPRPVLTVPSVTAPLNRALLAYDSSLKAREGLFVATYLAGKWQIPLTVLTIDANGKGRQLLDEAQQHLEKRGVAASFILKTGEIAEAVLTTAAEQACDLIIMGGYGHSPVVEVVLGSVVDQVLREAKQPLLICR